MESQINFNTTRMLLCGLAKLAGSSAYMPAIYCGKKNSLSMSDKVVPFYNDLIRKNVFTGKCDEGS